MLQIPVDDNEEADLFSYLSEACEFISTAPIQTTGSVYVHFVVLLHVYNVIMSSEKYADVRQAVLVYSKLGISRCSAICMAYIMHSTTATLEVQI